MSGARGGGAHAGLLAAVVAAGVCAAGDQLSRLRRQAPTTGSTGPSPLRLNYRGRPVSLAAGPAAVVGCLAGLRAARLGVRPALAVSICAVAGACDDWVGGHSAKGAKGLRGHAHALADGQVTTGAVKVVLIGMGGLLGAAAGRPDGALRRPGQALADAALLAASANVVNLFDLRPGRALKLVVVSGACLAVRRERPTAAALGAVAAGTGLGVLGWDLRERSMLGDTGANALGMVIGSALVAGVSPRGRVLALAGAVGVTMASELVSFSSLIDRCPPVAWADRWGRPAGPLTTVTASA